MDNNILIIVLAVATLGIAIGAALYFRARVAKSKGDLARSSFVKDHGEEARPNRPGTEH